MAIYRDNSKRVQPLSSSKSTTEKKVGPAAETVKRKSSTARCGASCPTSANPITHKFSIGGHEGYITVGMYDDGTPGEIFITMAKEGSTISGLVDAFATAVSFNLQYGVPLKFLVDKFAHVRFEPSGWTGESADPVRQVHHGLHIPLAGRAVPGLRVRHHGSWRDDDASPNGIEPAAGTFPAGCVRCPPVRRMRLHHDPQRKLL